MRLWDGSQTFGAKDDDNQKNPCEPGAIEQGTYRGRLGMDSIYWVLSRDCNQRCAHCYNDSEPGAPGLSLEQVDHCISHLPDPAEVEVERIILSGGEVLVWPDLLFHTLQRLSVRLGRRTELWVQTNGDLLDESTLDRLLAHNVKRVDVSSMDSFHPRSTTARLGYLTELFRSRGMVPAAGGEAASAPATFGFWGATPEQWIGPLWPRGRARTHGLSAAGPEHKFCGMWSGARNFLNYHGPGSEINLQLGDVYPCCPMTCRPIGSLLGESLISILDRCARHPVFQALNEGKPETMGESMGVSAEYARERTRELGNECLWCDEFFTTHATRLLMPGAITERGARDLESEVVQIHRKRPEPQHPPAFVATRTFQE